MKTFRLFSMAALALVMAACSSEDNALENATPVKPGLIPFSATVAPLSGATTRTEYTEVTSGDDAGKINVAWKKGDQIFIARLTPDLGTAGRVTVGEPNDDGSAPLSGNISGANGNEIEAYYPASAYDDMLTFTEKYNAQDGTLSGIQDNLDYRKGTGEISVIGGKATLADKLQMKSQIAIWKLTLQNTSGASLNATKVTIKDGSNIIAATKDISATSEVHMAVPFNTSPTTFSDLTIEATTADGTYTYAAPSAVNLSHSTYYQSTVKMAKVKPDLLSGVFSVSDSKKVSFSKGNLQATYDGSNWTWAFAANQWDYIGNAAGNTMVTATSPFISENATVDLFGWVGASSTWTAENKYGITSSSATNNTNGYGNVASESLKSDWGALIGLGWRTLSMAEWTYLLTTRTVNGGTGAGKSYTLNQSVNGKKGMVIYPDNYTGDVYSGSNWASFEAAGCVFLPAAGWRNGTTINNINDRGFYWSSTPATTTDAKRMFFAGGLDLSDTNSRAFGFSVRLVREVE